MRETISEKQLCDSNSGRSGSIHYNTAIFLLLSCYFQGIDDSGENNDSCSVLVIMENRNVQDVYKRQLQSFFITLINSGIFEYFAEYFSDFLLKDLFNILLCDGCVIRKEFIYPVSVFCNLFIACLLYTSVLGKKQCLIKL